MNKSPHSGLPPPPARLVEQGRPVFGRFAGSMESMDWSGLTGEFHRSAWWTRFHHKRWQYVAIATEQCFIGLAIVDVGWTNTAFAYLFDRKAGKVIAGWSQDGLPGLTASVNDRPAHGALSWFRHTGGALRFEHRGGDRYELTVSTRQGLQIEAVIDAGAAAPSLVAIGPIGPGGCAHATQKSAALRVQGAARYGGRAFPLDDGVASLDYSNGLLARDTQWRWASAHSFGLGFNLQEGYFGSQENVLWLDGQLIALGRAQFGFDPARPGADWHIRTDDGLLDLVFTVEGSRSENKNLLIAASHYIQPIGRFNGSVRSSAAAEPRLIRDLPGVTEDHRSRW